MNTPSPLIPQGTTPSRGKSSIYFKVLMILTVHVVVIGGMLLQGCKDTNSQTKTDTSNPQDTTAVTPNTSAPAGPDSSLQPLTSTANLSNTMTETAPAPVNPGVQPVMPQGPQLNPLPTPQSTLPTPMATPTLPSDAKEYVVVHGDTLGAIAHRNGVSLKALVEANPGVNPKRLHIGQKLQVPAGADMAAASPSSAAPTADAAPADGAGYTVKSGDMLLRIARAHGTSVRKIMAMNDLKSTSIRVGQKLKLPAPKTASVDNASAASMMQPPAAAAPVSVSASATAPPTPAVAN